MVNKDGWTTKGVSIKFVFQADWDEIHRIFDKYGCKLRKHGSTLTVNELKNVKLAEELTDSLKDNEKIRQWASLGIGIVEDDAEYERAIKRGIFEKLLWLIPEFSRQYSVKALRKYLDDSNTSPELKCLFTTNGPVHDTRYEVEAIVADLIKKIK